MLNYVRYTWYMPCRLARLTYLRVLRAFMPYAPLRLICFIYASYLRTLFTCHARITYAPYLRTLPTLFMCIKIFLGWICNLSKTFNFPRTIKGTTNYADFMRVERQPLIFFRWRKVLSIFKTWNQFNAFVLLFFSSPQPRSNKFFSLK